eukprot:CAMPEP_0206540804 /NCGR_PEP_ID=MMETSP0325_2-20121206/9227_1 /ASSEMBLY_ACC=CAM_ASM_000347 /TAXON_ID=2866 /ORGANISM="Crypthecodinium cohnii, Strain Seligo" /LENGTH=377 /DNA_ID=CAMNT_0054038605 /DNA_START=34 /DNA_END=1164 /DNA_ORIENTATION=+
MAAATRQMQMLVTRFERLSRRISLAGIMSGHKAVEAISQGRVKVDGKQVASNFKVFSEALVTVDGREAPAPRPLPRLWAMHKPRKVLCSDTETPEKEGTETIRSLLKSRHDREVELNGQNLSTGLDKETLFDKHFIIVNGLPFTADGLVLLTNDGLFADALRDPSNKILSAYDIKIAGDPPVDLLHSWRRSAWANGVHYGQVFTSILRRTGATSKLRLRYVESPLRPLELLLAEANMEVIALRRYAFGPYLCTDLPLDRLMEVAIHKSIRNLVPQADMRQALVPVRGSVVTPEGALRDVQLGNSAALGRHSETAAGFRSGHRGNEKQSDIRQDDMMDDNEKRESESGRSRRRSSSSQRAPIGENTFPHARPSRWRMK